jgi:hypothetical protein
MSMPDSMIVVQTSTSKRLPEVDDDLLERALVHLAVGDAMRASGTSSRSRAAAFSMSRTRLCTKNTWPSRSSSRRIASATGFARRTRRRR